MAASPDGAYVLATGRGIDVRPAGSATWQAATLDGPAPAGGFGYVGMTTDTQGIALPADPAAGTVWFTYRRRADLASVRSAAGLEPAIGLALGG